MRSSRDLTMLIFSLFLCQMLAMVRGWAQERLASESSHIYIGPGFGYGMGTISGTIPVMGGSNDCAGNFTRGSESSSFVYAEINAPDLLSSWLGIAIRSGWNRSTLLFTAAPSAPYTFVNPTSGELTRINDQYRLHGSSDAIRLEALLQIRTGSTWSIGIGPWLGGNIASSYSTADAIVGGELRFQGGAQEIPLQEGTTLTPSLLTAGGTVAFRFWQPIGSRFVLMPEVALRAELTSPSQESAWNGYTISVGAILGFVPGESKAPPLPPPPSTLPHATIAELPRPTSPPLPPVDRHPPSASLALYGLDESGSRIPMATIKVFDVLYRERTPLLSAVYFDQGSATIPPRYASLSDAEASAFSTDSLADSLLAAHYQILNIIGSRMQRNRRGIITIAGSASSEEPPALARARAESVGLYLMRTWHIDTTRLRIEVSPPPPSARRNNEDLRSELRRAGISSTDPGLLAPVVSRQIVRDYDPPAISLDPVWKAEAGLKEWRILLQQGGTIVGNFSSHDTGRNGRLNWEIVGAKDSATLAPIVARLTVVDSLGDSVTTSAEIPMSLQMNMRIVDQERQNNGSRERITFSLLAFDQNSDHISRRNRLIIDEAVATVRSGARVVVSGHADRTGSEGHNSELSRRRAVAAADAVRSGLKNRGTSQVSVIVAGTSGATPRFDNDLPEGRALSRQVEITIDQSTLQAGTGER